MVVINIEIFLEQICVFLSKIYLILWFEKIRFMVVYFGFNFVLFLMQICDLSF